MNPAQNLNNLISQFKLDKIDFNPAWSNGTGYYDKAVKGIHSPKLYVGQMVWFTDSNSRTGIIIGTRFGNCVIFERFSNGDRGIVVSNTPHIFRAAGMVKSGSLENDFIQSLHPESNPGTWLEQIFKEQVLPLNLFRQFVEKLGHENQIPFNDEWRNGIAWQQQVCEGDVAPELKHNEVKWFNINAGQPAVLVGTRHGNVLFYQDHTDRERAFIRVAFPVCLKFNHCVYPGKNGLSAIFMKQLLNAEHIAEYVCDVFRDWERYPELH